MKAKGVLPWIIVLASVGAAFYLYSANQAAQKELASARGEKAELTKLRQEVADLKGIEFSEAELERLRKEVAEVYKLRNEVRQLREENKQLADQPQQQAQPAPDAAALQQALMEAQQLRAENEALRNASGQPAASPSVEQNLTAYKMECINNLRQIDAATEQWAITNKKSPGDIPEYEGLLSFLPSPPVCPQGGAYTFSGVGKKPTCNMPEHVLP